MNSEELRQKYNQPIKVGDKGYVRFIDSMGTDSSICEAARCSYGAGTKSVSDDTSLIRYLIRNAHWSPVEMCELKVHMRVPIHVFRQVVRHRTASLNEYSTRYSIAIEDAEATLPNEWRLQSNSNKQGSAGFLEDLEIVNLWEATFSGKEMAEKCSSMQQSHLKFTRGLYNDLLKVGVAREQARNVLPLSTYTEAYWKIDLRNLFNFLQLRLDTHAQQETRELAQALASIAKDWCPIAYSAFEDYQQYAIRFSRIEQKLLGQKLQGKEMELSLLSKREQAEFLSKLEKLV